MQRDDDGCGMECRSGENTEAQIGRGTETSRISSKIKDAYENTNDVVKNDKIKNKIYDA